MAENDKSKDLIFQRGLGVFERYRRKDVKAFIPMNHRAGSKQKRVAAVNKYASILGHAEPPLGYLRSLAIVEISVLLHCQLIDIAWDSLRKEAHAA